MFDANMCYLKKGTKFFAKIQICKEGTEAHENGVRVGDIVACTMLTNDSENPRIEYNHSGGDFETRHKDEFMETWWVYEGRQDGTGFIDEKSRKIAMLED